VIAKILFKSGKHDESIRTLKSIIDLLRYDGPLNEMQYDLAKFYREIDQNDSSRKYALEALQDAIKFKNQVNIRDVSMLLADLYRNKDINKAYEYLSLSNAMKDSIADTEKYRKMQALQYKDQKAKNDLVLQDQAIRSRIKLNTVLAALLALAIILFFVWRNNQQKQKAKNKIEKAYSDLKSAQAQLIQSEKMASLGELTAGIAHEIQNPLNFVNNFSEINRELADELLQEADKGNLDEVKAIARDIKDNEQKINHHGKRADGIVKGMLQHSRSSNGKKEPTDINALANEYLRLAYHGLRAKDNSFNASMKTDFDETVGNINIIPQDIGRVILNLITNAFYAVTEKKKQAPNGYEPLVTVSTKKIEGKVEIKVSDNGNGIPQKLLDKIFQPFFTTKPTGQGTGLGLSLSYDIIKGHGGEIKVQTTEGEGSEFIIRLIG
jgi:signal transduction histidine kinase